MADNILVLVFGGSLTTIIGLLFGEFLNLRKEQRRVEQKKKNRAILLKFEIERLTVAIDSYHNLCHRPFFDDNKEAICLARRLEKKSILSLVLDEIQNIGEDIVLFDLITQNLLFDLKWAISDLIKTSNYISKNSAKLEKRDELEEDDQLNLDMYIILLHKDEDFLLNKCQELVSYLNIEFDLFDYKY